jgi:hypothetical protein
MVDPEAEATFPRASDCVYGVVSFWMHGAESFADGWWDREAVLSNSRWENDAVYRKTLADGNLLTYLTVNGDTHSGNWVKVPTQAGTRVYLVDGSISFSRLGNLSLGPSEDFADLIVPAVRERSLKRMLSLGRAELSRLLAVERLVSAGQRLESKRALDEVDPDLIKSAHASGKAMRWASCNDSPDASEQLIVGLAPHELSLVRRQLWYLRARHAMGELELLKRRKTPP